jgi:hypothetical protein
MPHKEKMSKNLKKGGNFPPKIPKKEFDQHSSYDLEKAVVERGVLKSMVKNTKAQKGAIKTQRKNSQEATDKANKRKKQEMGPPKPEKRNSLIDKSTKGSPPFSDKEINRGYRNIK